MPWESWADTGYTEATVLEITRRHFKDREKLLKEPQPQLFEVPRRYARQRSGRTFQMIWDEPPPDGHIVRDPQTGEV